MKRFIHSIIGIIIITLGITGIVFCIYFLCQGWSFPGSIILLALALLSLGTLIAGALIVSDPNISIRDTIAAIISGLLSLWCMTSQTKTTLTAATFTFAWYIILLSLVPIHFMNNIFGYTLGYYASYMVWPLLAIIAASVPGQYLLERKIATNVSIAAAFMAFALIFTLTPIFASLAVIIYALSIIGAYFLSAFIFKDLKIKHAYKVLLVVGVFVFVLILDRVL